MLLRLLDRFGPLPPGVAERIGAAKLDELERWAERAASAASLGQVFRRLSVGLLDGTRSAAEATSISPPRERADRPSRP